MRGCHTEALPLSPHPLAGRRQAGEAAANVFRRNSIASYLLIVHGHFGGCRKRWVEHRLRGGPTGRLRVYQWWVGHRLRGS